MALLWQANSDIVQHLEELKEKHHPHLETARIALGFVESKPFIKGRFNWGKTSKFSKLAKLWQEVKYDFCIVLCSDAWHDILNTEQRDALLDLHLSRCSVEYEPAIVEENGVKKVVKDEFGRVQYTTEMRFDDEGIPKWTVLPLDLNVFADNASRYGLWCDELLEFQSAVRSFKS